MKLFQKKENRSALSSVISSVADIFLGKFSFNTINDYSESTAYKLSTVFRCLNLISDSIASLPFNLYKYKDNWKYIEYSDLWYVLNTQPNNYMSAYTFKKLAIINMLAKGNTYIYIERNKLNINALHILNSDNIKIKIQNSKKIYVDTLTNKVYNDEDIIHLINYTNDGLTGISTLHYAANSLDIAVNSETHSGNWFRGGANLSGILTPKEGVQLNDSKAQKAKERFINATSNDQTTGISNGVVVLDNGFDFQPITVNPKDSQLLESRQFNVLEICRFFNVPPALAFNDTGSYNSTEQMFLSFLSNTLLPIIEKIENEFFRKLIDRIEWPNFEIKIDTENLLRADNSARADYFVKLHSVGGFTTNEIREKLNCNFPVAGGNRAFIQTNLQPSDHLFVDNKEAKIDNNLKTKKEENEN